MPVEIMYPPVHRHSSTINCIGHVPREETPFLHEPYGHNPYSSQKNIVSTDQVVEFKPWLQDDRRRRLNKDEDRLPFLTYNLHPMEHNPHTARPYVVLPPPSSLIPPHEASDEHVVPHRPQMHHPVSYTTFVNRKNDSNNKFERSNRKKRAHPFPSPIVTSAGYHYEVLNMTKRKRSKRDSAAAETLTLFSQKTHNDRIAEGLLYDGGNEDRGHARGDSRHPNSSQTVVLEAARILCALSTTRITPRPRRTLSGLCRSQV